MIWSYLMEMFIKEKPWIFPTDIRTMINISMPLG
jgi:hypothetical protein